jgi:hypothetical protein
MSKFTEYLHLIPKGLANPGNILEGWINDLKLENGTLKEDEVAEILRRRSICEQCPFNSILAKTSQEYYDTFNENYKTERTDLHCSVCACPIKKKTASLDSECGLGSDKKALEKNGGLKWTTYSKQNNTNQ